MVLAPKMGASVSTQRSSSFPSLMRAQALSHANITNTQQGTDVRTIDLIRYDCMKRQHARSRGQVRGSKPQCVGKAATEGLITSVSAPRVT